MTASILIESWKYEQGEADLTVMQVEAEGKLGDEQVRLCWDLLDYYDSKQTNQVWLGQQDSPQLQWDE